MSKNKKIILKFVIVVVQYCSVDLGHHVYRWSIDYWTRYGGMTIVVSFTFLKVQKII